MLYYNYFCIEKEIDYKKTMIFYLSSVISGGENVSNIMSMVEKLNKIIKEYKNLVNLIPDIPEEEYILKAIEAGKEMLNKRNKNRDEGN